MTYQLTMFGPSEKQLRTKKKYLEELIALKKQEMFEEEFRGFFGTAEAIALKEKELDHRVARFITELRKAFPEIEWE
ncbi:hypothetical protein [Aneurinibacillus thermoaerophilus]|jgi:D-serine dehydratase|uniref:hypothetical protein n=1 Tax=Aneurinibacillus thermoaerophilus TaxID=143495 RepID=UPI002E1EA6BD|nr:hypothetical protein [Aneurinibacillus thermoaerophilus]